MEQLKQHNVLLIGYLWPYVFGGHRMIGLVKHLPGLGWRPLVLTQPLEKKPDPPPCQIIEVPFKGDIFRHWRSILRKILGSNSEQGLKAQIKERMGVSGQKSFMDKIFNFYQEVLGYPDTEKAWKAPALEKSLEIIEKEKISAIISNYPVTSHLVAAKIKQVTNLPWIADFTDLWSQNHNYLFGKVRRFMDEKCERKTLKQADCLVTVSEPWTKILRELHGRSPDTVFSIQHGFDPSMLNEPVASLSSKFRIVYTGRIYSEMQNPEPFFISVRRLIDRGILETSSLEIHFYGDRDVWVREQVERFGLDRVCHFFDRLPKQQIVHKQREAQILLLLALNHENQRGCYTSKIYDYLAAKRPILAVGGFSNDVIAELITQTQTGVHATTAEEIDVFLMNCYRQFKETGKVDYSGISESVNSYNHLEMTRQFVTMLNRMVG